MKKRYFSIFMICGGLSAIISSCIYLISGKSIPGLSPLSLAIVMFSLPYSSYDNYTNGKIRKTSWQTTLWGGLIAGTLNVIAGIFQIIVALRK